jgi:hypothetical protein
LLSLFLNFITALAANPLALDTPPTVNVFDNPRLAFEVTPEATEALEESFFKFFEYRLLVLSEPCY